METMNRMLVRYWPLVRVLWAAVMIVVAACDGGDGGGTY
jgi:hypothetical protein